MRILITNDDGIEAPGLRALVDWAKKLGEVEVFAPKVEQSGKSAGLELRKAFKVEKVEYEGVAEAYAIDSTPVDCVRIAVLGFERKYDLVLSGVNCGMNLGHDINYSGTCGAIFEGAMHGIKGIGFSAGKKGNLPLKLRGNRLGKCIGVGDEDGRGILIVLCLRKKVSGNMAGI